MRAGMPLIGRAAELEALTLALDGDRATVLLGEAGIGKTALVRAAAAQGDRALREGGAFATLRATPYLALRRAVEVGLRGDPATVAARVEQAIGPDLLFVDDAQWADDATLAAVGLLVGRIALVAAVRALDPGASRAVGLLRGAGATVHDVPPLTTDAARELVAARRPDLSGQVVDDIVRRAAGNPLLLEEMAVGGEAPPVLARALTGRLDQLSDAAREVVELLAIAERPLPRAGLPDAALEAIDVGIAMESGRGVELRHQLVGDAVRERLPEADRRRLHALIAELTPDRGGAARHLAAAGRTDAAAELAVAALESTTDARERAALLEIAAEASPATAAVALRLEAARALDEVSDWPGVAAVLRQVPLDAEAAAVAEAQALLAHATFALGDIGACREHLAAMDAVEVPGDSPAAVRRAIEAATFLVNVEGAVAAAIERLDAAAGALSRDASGAEDLAALRASILLLASGTGDVDRIRAAADAAFDAARYRTATDRARVVQYFFNLAVGSEPALDFLLDRHARYAAAGLGSMAHEFLADAVVAAMLCGRLRCRRDDGGSAARGAGVRASSADGEHLPGAHARAPGPDRRGRGRARGVRPAATADFWGLGELLTGLAEAAFWGGRPDLARQRAEAALVVPAPLPVAHAHGHLALAWACRELGLEPPAAPEVGWTPSTSGTPLELAALSAAAAGSHLEAARGFTAAAEAWRRFHEPRALTCRGPPGTPGRSAGDAATATAELRAALATPTRCTSSRSRRASGARCVSSANACPRRRR